MDDPQNPEPCARFLVSSYLIILHDAKRVQPKKRREPAAPRRFLRLDCWMRLCSTAAALAALGLSHQFVWLAGEDATRCLRFAPALRPTMPGWPG
jgi:hypothetical protein